MWFELNSLGKKYVIKSKPETANPINSTSAQWRQAQLTHATKMASSLQLQYRNISSQPVPTGIAKWPLTERKEWRPVCVKRDTSATVLCVLLSFFSLCETSTYSPKTVLLTSILHYSSYSVLFSEAVFWGEREKRPVDVETKFLTIIFSARATKKISGTDLNTKWLIRPHRKRPWVLLETCLFVNRGQHQVKANSWCYDSIRYRYTLKSDQWMVNSNVPNLKFMSVLSDRNSVQFAPWQKR